MHVIWLGENDSGLGWREGLKKKSSALSFQSTVILKFNPGHKHEDDIAKVTVCDHSVYLTRYHPKNIRERANIKYNGFAEAIKASFINVLLYCRRHQLKTIERISNN